MWTQSKCSATARVLLPWSWPVKCQVSLQVGQRLDLGQGLLQVILAKILLAKARENT